MPVELHHLPGHNRRQGLRALETIRLVAGIRCASTRRVRARRCRCRVRGLASGAVAIAGTARRASLKKHATTYGSARWADPSDVRAAQLQSDRGVVLGLYDGRYLRHNGPEHVLAVAPTRSGKGVGLVLPTLLTWSHSAVVHDIKGEN
jgi:type IV secretory pathway TraG/TraD family ATPase VirD4